MDDRSEAPGRVELAQGLHNPGGLKLALVVDGRHVYFVMSRDVAASLGASLFEALAKAER